MPTEESDFEILPGAVIETAATVTIVDSASAGTSGALRRLIHPLSGTFPVVTYNCNPDRTINFDQIPLVTPETQAVRTLGTTQVLEAPSSISDVIVTEIWESRGKVSMLTSQFRRFYELRVNPPAPATPEVFIQWAPADRSTEIFNVQIVGLRVGGQSGRFDVKDLGAEQLTGIDTVLTGALDRRVELDLKLISQVV